MAKTILSKATSADVMIANGKWYHIDRVDCDDKIIYVHDMDGQDFIIDLHIVAFMEVSEYVHFYILEELT